MIFVPTTETDYVVATSYLAVVDADELINAQPDSSEWASLSVDVKKVVLNQSSLAVDGAFAYKGLRTDSGQLLKFPRAGSVSVPVSLKYAVALLSLQYAKDEALKGITSETIVKMSWTFSEVKGGMSNAVMAFLRPLRAKGVRINQ